MRERITRKWRNTILGEAAHGLSRSERRKIAAVALIQVSFGLLDLLGIAAVGMLGALAISGVESQQPGNRVGAVLDILHLADNTLQTQAAVLGLAAASLLVGKTIVSIFFTKKILYFLSRRGARISSMLIEKFLSKSLLEIQSRPAQQTLFAVTTGVEAITMGILSSAIAIVSDFSLLIILSIGLFAVDFRLSVIIFFTFGVIGFSLYKAMHRKAQFLGAEFARLSISGNEKILEVLHLYREAVVSNRRSYYAEEIGKIRFNMADANAEIKFMPNISKYVIELTMVLGALSIGASQFLIHDAAHAVAVITVFLAASTRIAPAILRIQQSAMQISSQSGNAALTLQLISELSSSESISDTDNSVHTKHSGFEATTELVNVSLTYPGKGSPAVDDVSLVVLPGTVLAIVGPSGAGKTTLADLLLGVLSPDSGGIYISGLAPLQAVKRWPGGVAYVPQNVVVTNGTVRENVGLGFPVDRISDELVWDALRVAQLEEFLIGIPDGIDAHLGDAGSDMSGGQRQRLGIARAMFTKPKLLVLDEATSSLDGETEANVTESIHALKGEVTVILIAHRLSTVRAADVVVYMDKGKIVAKGTFDEVRALVPDFDKQAQLMGL